jgi:hypothetical protein
MKVGLENQSDTMMIRVRNVLENTMNLQSHLRSCLVLTGRSRYASLFNLSKRIIKGGQMVSEERVTPQTQISREAHIIY